MASLIVHGDLSAPSIPLPRPIHVQPILRPYEDFNKNIEERTPHDRLLVDLIHSAVVRIKGTDTVTGSAPRVKVINLSIGNSWQPFFRDLSPLAKLLDWLAWKYKILFIVSVGNQWQDIEPAFATADITTLSDDEVRARTLEALHRDQVCRRPFAPAEAVNVLTVGAVHADGSAWVGDQRVDLLRGANLPSPISTIASGYNRSVKPDILFPGGRQLYLKRISATLPPRFSVAKASKAPGLCVAAPGELPMELERTTFSRGTSNATALATRTAALIYERLLALRSEPGGDRLTDEYVSVILKALLVHGASWGAAADLLDAVFGPRVGDWRELLRLKARFLGYGEVEPNRALFSEDHRVLMLGWDSLFCDQGHDYSVPLPPSLSGQKVKRRLTVTLAWFSPVNPRHRGYRQALLWFSPEEEKLALKKKDVDADSSRRGTVQHQIFEGDKVRAFADGDKLVVKVSCAAEAGKLADYIPYGIAVTLEIAEPMDLKIFTEMKDRIRLKVGVRPKSS
jgi:Subtilase family